MIEKFVTSIGPYKVEVHKPDTHVTSMRFLQSDGFVELARIDLPDNYLVDLYQQMNFALLWGLDCLFTTPVVSANGDRYNIWLGHSDDDSPPDDDPDSVYFAIYTTWFAKKEEEGNVLFGSWMNPQEPFNFLLSIEPIVEDIERCTYR